MTEMLVDGANRVLVGLERKERLFYVVVVALIVGSGFLLVDAQQSRAAEVRVVRCHTEFGIPHQLRPRTPSGIGVPLPGGASGLVVYTNTEGYLLGPRGMRCAGTVATDGSSDLVVWRGGAKPLKSRSRESGLSLTVIPACAGCKALEVCPFFAGIARRWGFPCEHGIPAGERVSYPSRRLALFEDPPGVAGSGWPSGGPDPANGVVGIVGTEPIVYRATCTLPRSRRNICTDVLNDVIRSHASARAAWAERTSASRGQVMSAQRQRQRSSAATRRKIAISRSGSIGALRLNVSTAAEIRGVWGTPAYAATGNVGAPASYPDYRQLGYRCRRRNGYIDCAINFYVSESTGRLESFMTRSPRFSLFGGVHVGMSADLASRRERKPNVSGCGQFIAVSTPQMSVDVDTVGGRRSSRGYVSGGHVSRIAIDQRLHGVGLLFC